MLTSASDMKENIALPTVRRPTAGATAFFSFGHAPLVGKLRRQYRDFPEQNQPDLPCPAPTAKIFRFRFSEICDCLPASRAH
jgi:hypothetical protein